MLNIFVCVKNEGKYIENTKVLMTTWLMIVIPLKLRQLLKIDRIVCKTTQHFT